MNAFALLLAGTDRSTSAVSSPLSKGKLTNFPYSVARERGRGGRLRTSSEASM